MVLRIQITRHPATTGIENNNGTRLGRRLVLRWLVNADCDMLGDLLVVYVTEISS